MDEIDETTLKTSKINNKNIANSYVHSHNDRPTKNKNKSRSNLEIEV